MSDTYYPQEIKDQAFAGIESSGSDTTGKTYTTEIYRPLSEVDKTYPPRIIAHETISQSLDTKQKKIRGEFAFSKEGSIQIGGYVNGVSGEIIISPLGLTAKNVNGETTVAIDGTTGDAIFKGEVKGGSFVSEGNVTISATGAFIVNDGTNNIILLGYQSGGF